MSIVLACRSCGRSSRVDAAPVGGRVTCPACGAAIVMPPPVMTPPPFPPPPFGGPVVANADRPYAGGPRPVVPVVGYGPAPARRPGWKLWVLLGVGVAFVGVVVLGAIRAAAIKAERARVAAAAAQLQATAATSAAANQTADVANLPPRPAITQFQPGVQFGEVRAGDTAQTGLRLWVYLPGDRGTAHPPASLPCVLVAPAGSNLLTGMALGDGDRAEHLPYVRAGYAVIAYELDGKVPGGDPSRASDAAVVRAIRQFMAADAGRANARAALDYLAARVPEVDPARVYAAGHSSAGTLAVQLAATEPRIKAAVAYAPCTDIAGRHGRGSLRSLEAAVPGVTAFVDRVSPARLGSPACPLLLFHAEDDSNVPVRESRAYAARFPGRVTLAAVPTGDHYDAMIEQGIPKAIAWFNERGARPWTGRATPVASRAAAPGTTGGSPDTTVVATDGGTPGWPSASPSTFGGDGAPPLPSPPLMPGVPLPAGAANGSNPDAGARGVGRGNAAAAGVPPAAAPGAPAAKPGEWADLLKGLDPAAATWAGEWRIEPDGSLSGARAMRMDRPRPGERTPAGQMPRGFGSPRIQLAKPPAEEYEVEFTFNRTRMPKELCLLFPVGDRPAQLWLGGRAGQSSSLEGVMESHAPPTAPRIVDGRDHAVRVRVEVTADGATAAVDVTLDGQPYLAYRGPRARLGVRPDFALPDKDAIGLAVHTMTAARFKAVRVRSLDAGADAAK